MSITLQYHWKRLNPTQQPRPHLGSSLVFDKKQQRSILNAAGETWLWDGVTWSKAQSTPPARNSTHQIYDTGTESVLLFGGIGLDGTPLNDTWIWDGTTWKEQHPADFPSPLGGAAIAYIATQQQVILFGGITGFDGTSGSNRTGTLLNDTWIWDGTTWTEMLVSNAPPKRVSVQLIYDELHQQTLLFGGNLNDMWRWNGTGWDELHPATLPPFQARYSTVYHKQLQQVMLLAELREGGKLTHQIWLWDGTTWSQSSMTEDLMGTVEGLAYDETRNLVIANVVTGGKLVSTENPAPLESETWVWG